MVAFSLVVNTAVLVVLSNYFLVLFLDALACLLVAKYSVQVCHSFSSKEQVSFNIMAAVTICSDFGAPQNKKSLTVSIISLSICHEVMGLDAMILVFSVLSFQPGFLLSCFIFIKRFFIREMKIKTIMRSCLTPVRMPIIKKVYKD